MGGTISTLEREDAIRVMREELAVLEKLLKESEEKPTTHQEWNYNRHLASFKMGYRVLVAKNPTDPVALELLNRVTRLNAVWNRRVRPESYDYGTPH